MLKKFSPTVRPEASEGQLWGDAKTLITNGAITPFISNSLAADIFGGEAMIAKSWAADDNINSPLTDSDNRNLARVAQYFSVQIDNRRDAKKYYLDSLTHYLFAMAQDSDPEGVEELSKKSKTLPFSAIAHQLGYPKVSDVNHNPLRLLAELPLPI